MTDLEFLVDVIYIAAIDGKLLHAVVTAIKNEPNSNAALLANLTRRLEYSRIDEEGRV